MSTARGMRARPMAVAAAALVAVCAGILASAQPAGAAPAGPVGPSPSPSPTSTGTVSASPSPTTGFVPIAGAGSTWSYNAIHAWVTSVAQQGMTVNYAAVGSTVGRTDFTAGLVDWAASDIPYGVQDGSSYDPPPARGYAYMPDTAGAVAFMYNLSIEHTYSRQGTALEGTTER